MILRVIDSRIKMPWCSVCGAGRESLTCFLPYGRRSSVTRGGAGQYHVCCSKCREAILAHPGEYVTKETCIRSIASCYGSGASVEAIEGGS